MKTCKRCQRTLPLDVFSRNAAAKDGKQSYCRDCKREYAVEWYRNASPETKARHIALKRARRPKYRAKESASHKQWLLDNRERTREHDAKRRATVARKQWAADYWKKWKAAHPELVREYARRGQQARRARKIAAFVEHVAHDRVFKRDEGICGICELPADPADWHLDHIVPLALGGEHSYANVRVTHPKCNIARARATRDEKARREVAA